MLRDTIQTHDPELPQVVACKRRFQTSNVEQLESQVKGLNADELKAFRDWFAKFDADAWDQQIEADSKRGALDSLASRALADYQAGRSTTL